MSEPDLIAVLNAVHGFLPLSETQLLYQLAAEVPAGGAIVEIGSYQGRSTVALGLGAKAAKAWVWAVDPHDDVQITEATHYGMENHAALLKNLLDFGVADHVRLIGYSSMAAVLGWEKPIHLLWIDGCHDYEAVRADFKHWSPFVAPDGRIALHDTSGHFPDITRLVDEILKAGRWKTSDQIDATMVLTRS